MEIPIRLKSVEENKEETQPSNSPGTEDGEPSQVEVVDHRGDPSPPGKDAPRNEQGMLRRINEDSASKQVLRGVEESLGFVRDIDQTANPSAYTQQVRAIRYLNAALESYTNDSLP